MPFVSHVFDSSSDPVSGKYAHSGQSAVTALKTGYTHLDLAEVYANDVSIGKSALAVRL